MKRIRFPGMMNATQFIKKTPELMDQMMNSPQVKYVAHALDLIELTFRVANFPIIRRFHPWVQHKNNKCYPIPINQDLERGKDVTLPYQVVEELIDRSSHRIIMDICGCRVAYNCQGHPKDIGCLMMGEDSQLIKTPFARQVTKEEAKEHLQKAVDANLPPFIGKSIIDNFIFGVPDRGKLFTVCFCCDCCCLGRIYKYMPAKRRNVQVNKLEGLEVYVDMKKCNGCEQCLEHCNLNLITMSGGIAHISDDCRGCGRCARLCPQDAIRMRLDNPNFAADLIKNLETHVSLS